MAKRLFVKGTDRLVGVLTEGQWEDLVEHLEEEHAGDRDYYIDGSVVAYLAEKGAEPRLVAMLRQALGARGLVSEARETSTATPEEGLEVEWRED